MGRDEAAHEGVERAEEQLLRIDRIGEELEQIGGVGDVADRPELLCGVTRLGRALHLDLGEHRTRHEGEHRLDRERGLGAPLPSTTVPPRMTS